MHALNHPIKGLLLAGLALTMAGCAVGPDFHKPAVPQVMRYTADPVGADTAAESQRFAAGKDIPGQWWTSFGSPALNELVAAALLANPDLQAAEAALRAARETAAAQQGSLFPSVDVHLNPTRQSIANTLSSPTASGTNIYTLHTAQLNIGYVPDVFGGVRRQIESAAAQAEMQRFQRNAAYLSLTSNLVVAVIQEASLRAQLQATRELTVLAARQLELVSKQRTLGQLGAADVAAQESLLAQVQAGLPPLEKQLAQQRNVIAVLVGRFPSEDLVQRFELSSLTLPQELPLSLPAQLVEQRPDIRASEAQLHAASAQIGVAIANRLPNITLSANLGSSALDFSKLFTSGTGFWGVGADLAQPIFRGGTLMHQQRAAEALYDQAAAQYRSTVLSAFQNVADTLHAIDADGKVLIAAQKSERAAYRSFVIAGKQWEMGAAGSPAVLLAQQNYQQASIGLVQAQANRLTDSVALFQALGGGWWNRDQ